MNRKGFGNRENGHRNDFHVRPQKELSVLRSNWSGLIGNEGVRRIGRLSMLLLCNWALLPPMIGLAVWGLMLSTGFELYASLVFGIGLVIGGFGLLRGIVYWITTKVVITNRRVVLEQGIWRRTHVSLMLSRVNGVSAEESFLGRLLNYGDLTVDTGGGASGTCIGIHNASVIRKAIISAIADDDSGRSGHPEWPLMSDWQ